MDVPHAATAETRLLAATGRSTLPEALTWIADGYALDGDEQQLLRDLASLPPSSDVERAAQTLTRRVSHSTFDSASVLFRIEAVPRPAQFRAVLDRLATLAPDRTLVSIDPSTVIAAQRDDPFTIEVLCAVAGLSYGDLIERVAGLPSAPRSSWTPSQGKAAFAAIDAIVTGRVTSELTGTVAMRPVDLLTELHGGRKIGGWDLVEDQRTRGVPYETLLAQRVVGSAWGVHRNATSSMLNYPIALQLANELNTRGIPYRRSTSVGGDTPPSELQKMADCDGQIGLLAIDRRGRPRYAVAFSSARDSGTARKNAGSLRGMRRDPVLPMAIVVSGPGWAQRNETADLALAFGGRIFADKAIADLADDIASAYTERTIEGTTE